MSSDLENSTNLKNLNNRDGRPLNSGSSNISSNTKEELHCGKSKRKVAKSKETILSQLKQLSVSDGGTENIAGTEYNLHSCKYGLKTTHKQANARYSSAAPNLQQSTLHTRPATSTIASSIPSDIVQQPTKEDAQDFAVQMHMSAVSTPHQQIHNHYNHYKTSPSIVVEERLRKLDNRCQADANNFGLHQQFSVNSRLNGSSNCQSNNLTNSAAPTSGAKRYITRSSRTANRHRSPTSLRAARSCSTPSPSPSPTSIRKTSTQLNLAASAQTTTNARSSSSSSSLIIAMTQAPDWPNDNDKDGGLPIPVTPKASHDASHHQLQQQHPDIKDSNSFAATSAATTFAIVIPPPSDETTDKRKEEELQQQYQHQRFSAPTSPRITCMRACSSSSPEAQQAKSPKNCRADTHSISPLRSPQLSPAMEYSTSYKYSSAMILYSNSSAGCDKSAKRKSNLNRAVNEEQIVFGDDIVDDSSIVARRRRRHELAFVAAYTAASSFDAYTSHPELEQESQHFSNQKCDIKTDSLPLSPLSDSLRKLRSDEVNNKLNERTKADLAEIMKMAEQASGTQEQSSGPQPVACEVIKETPAIKISPILRQKIGDDSSSPPLPMPLPPQTQTQPQPPTQNHIVSILKKKDHHHHHVFGESSSASSNASPVTFSSTVIDVPTKQKRTGILKKRSSLDESRCYSRSHSPDERTILIKTARRNSFDESPAGNQQQGILKQSSYDSNKSDGCPSATETHPPSILKKKDSTSTPSDGGGGAHAHKHVSISQAVILAAAELGHDASELEYPYNDNSYNTPNNEEQELRPILKQESTSSEEYARPPKPILKKKSSGDSDELEIRPILKTSRKSSREETDYGYNGGDSSDGASVVRPILKSDSPSKRRSLGTVATQNEQSPPKSLLKRRTRSLERQGGAPVLDLAEALNAIATSQAAQSMTSYTMAASSSIATPGSISVAERIKNMEKFLRTQSPATPATPLSSNPVWQISGDYNAAKLLLKPRVLRRDANRERYKTQPVTSIECLKATSTPFDDSLTSGFRPTMAAEAARSFDEDITPIIDSITPSGFTDGLNRSSHQRLSLNGAAEQHSESYSSLGSEGSNGSKSAMQSLIDNAMNDKESNEISSQSAQNVRGRASMFQRLQQKYNGIGDSSSSSSSPSMPNRQERILTQTSRRLAVSTSDNLNCNSTLIAPAIPPKPRRGITTNATSELPAKDAAPVGVRKNEDDEEFEPSSLSLAERLRFFSSLSAGSTMNQRGRFERRNTSNGFSIRSHTPTYAEIERSSSLGSPSCAPHTLTPFSSTATSSNRATPSPMDCSPTRDQDQNRDSDRDRDSGKEESTEEYVPKLNPPLLSAVESNDLIVEPSEASTLKVEDSRETLRATASNLESIQSEKRAKIRTIGKLVLPNTFLNRSAQDVQDVTSSVYDFKPKKIGKIKSPFIEQQEQQQQQQQIRLIETKEAKKLTSQNSLTSVAKTMKLNRLATPHSARAALETSHINVVQSRKADQSAMHSSDETTSTDSGKENCERATETVIVEMRRKLSRLVSGHQKSSELLTPTNVTRRAISHNYGTGSAGTASSSSSGSNSNRSSCAVDERYARYFGVKSSSKCDEKAPVNVTPYAPHTKLYAATYTSSALTKKELQQATHHIKRMLSPDGSPPPKRDAAAKRPRPLSIQLSSVTRKSIVLSETTPPPMPPNSTRTPRPNLMRQRPVTLTEGMDITPQKTPVNTFDDIVVTKEELLMAAKEFNRLFCELF